MNKTSHAFWYRPFWQQILPVSLLIVLSLTGYYFQYWSDKEKQIISLRQDNTELVTNTQQEMQFIDQSATSSQLEQQISELRQLSEFEIKPQTFIARLQSLIANSKVTLNKLQPRQATDTDSLAFQLEIQGSFIHIYHFIQAMILEPSANAWLFFEINLKDKNGHLTAAISISSTKNTVFINDDLHIKEDSSIKDIE